MTATDIRYDAPGALPAAALNTGADAPSKMARLMLLMFMLGMVLPVWIRVGPLLLMPHRIVLLLTFVPMFFLLVSGRAGRLQIFDFLMLASALWAVLALTVGVVPEGGSLIEQVGIYMLESFGAYMLARVAIRSAADFIYFAKLFFLALLVLVPFGVVEAITHRAIMLELIPMGPSINHQLPRWGLRRAQTVFSHPILFGLFCSAGLGLMFYVMRSSLTRFSGAVLAAVGTFVSLSTGALISGVVQGVFMAWDRVMRRVPRRWLIFSILFAMLYVAIDLLSNRTPFHVLVTYASFNSGNAYNRILIWRFGMENVWANPMFGLGANIDQWARPSWMSSSADNFWLLHTMRFGIPSFLFLAVALFYIIRRAALAPLTDPRAIACRAGWLIAIGGMIITGGTVHYWHAVMAFVMFFFGAGVWIIEAGERARNQPEAGEAGPDIAEVSDPGALVYTREPAQHSRDRPTPPPEPVTRATPPRRAIRRGDR
ncbi:MAG: O-antigen ligase family protein [Pseudomonadota bacterium]